MASATPNPSSSSPSPPPSPRKRYRSPSWSPSPRSHHNGDDRDGGKRRRTDLTVEVCKDFIRHICRRSQIDCKFAHPHSTVSVERDKVTACADSLRNHCFRGRTCRYYHPPPHIQESLLKAIGIQDPRVETVCRDFMRGRCLRAAKECRFAHHMSIDQCAIVCQDFLRGKCERKSCRYSHVQAHATAQVHVQQHGAAMKPSSSPPRTGNDQEILPVCKDFLKKMCNRDLCKYAHPDSQTKVIDNQVEVCRDFRRGICHRSLCRFYHPAAAKPSRLVHS
uniref:Zinc finger CCCH domain-containing protein 28 isoform X1 n=1 Tax=Elaeis guineensis var. tenera TaxID=51953 RepID=A0A6I9RQ25_ELAGV|nr:zinc finger CCCH domain-containing protein 28 isoform X1 [Elaeis guineensis]XP_010930615.1 zinc finger CCCH domain-containing protein 28 isoform X1 [Elaeis guineensis]XP_019708191.1 zinc finger CCCH domain-containing protein 28 isoform X1 [Elaeis guineensis]